MPRIKFETDRCCKVNFVLFKNILEKGQSPSNHLATPLCIACYPELSTSWEAECHSRMKIGKGILILLQTYVVILLAATVPKQSNLQKTKTMLKDSFDAEIAEGAAYKQ